MLSAFVESNIFLLYVALAADVRHQRSALTWMSTTKLSDMFRESNRTQEKKEEKNGKLSKFHRPIAHSHIYISLLTLTYSFFSSLSFSVLTAGGNLTKLCANSENLALVGPFATNVSSNEARVGCPIPTSWVWDREKKEEEKKRTKHIYSYSFILKNKNTNN